MIAYVTDSAPLNLHTGDVLVTDASHHAIASGQTSAKVLEILHSQGVHVHSCPGLHAKMVILDDVLISSSANASGNSITGSMIEAGTVTDHPTTVSAAVNFVEEVRKQNPQLSTSRINSLLKIEVKKPFFRGQSSLARNKPNAARMPRTWIASYYQTASLSALDEQEAEEGREEATKLVADANAEVAFVHYGLKSNFAQSVRPGDYIIWLSRPRSASERPVFVYRGSRVLPAKSGTHHRFLYYESSPKAKEQRMRWGMFKDLCEQIGVPFKISRNTERELPEAYSDALNDLWLKTLAR